MKHIFLSLRAIRPGPIAMWKFISIFNKSICWAWKRKKWEKGWRECVCKWIDCWNAAKKELPQTPLSVQHTCKRTDTTNRIQTSCCCLICEGTFYWQAITRCAKAIVAFVKRNAQLIGKNDMVLRSFRLMVLLFTVCERTNKRPNKHLITDSYGSMVAWWLDEIYRVVVACSMSSVVVVGSSQPINKCLIGNRCHKRNYPCTIHIVSMGMYLNLSVLSLDSLNKVNKLNRFGFDFFIHFYGDVYIYDQQTMQYQWMSHRSIQSCHLFLF